MWTRRALYFVGLLLMGTLLNFAVAPVSNAAPPACDPALGPANPIDCIPPEFPGDGSDPGIPIDNPDDGGGTDTPVDNPDTGGDTGVVYCDPALGTSNPPNCVPPVDPVPDDGGDSDVVYCDPALGTSNPPNCVPPVDPVPDDGGDSDVVYCDPALGTNNPPNCVPPVSPGDGGDSDVVYCDPALGSDNPPNCVPPVSPGDGGDSDVVYCDPALGTNNPPNCVPPVSPGDGGDSDVVYCDPALGTNNPPNCVPPVSPGDGGDSDIVYCDPTLGTNNPPNCVPPVSPGDGGDSDVVYCDPALGADNPGNCVPPVNPDDGTGLPVCTADMLTNGVPCVPERPAGDPGTCDPGDGSYIPAVGDPGGVAPDGSDTSMLPLCFPPPDASNIGNFGSDDIGSLEPGSFAGFTEDHISNLNPTAVAGITDEQIAKLATTAVASFTPEQVANLSSTALTGIKADQVANLNTSAVAGLTAEQMANINPAAVSGFTPAQFEMLNPTALAGFTRSNLSGLNTEVIRSMNAQQLQNLNPAEVQNMSGNATARLLTNLNDPSITPADVASMLPEGWSIDESTGAMIAPAGANLAFRTLLSDGDVDGTTLPDLPDFSGTLALGGNTGDNGKNVLTGLTGALRSASLEQYEFQQSSDGILNIVDNVNDYSPLAAFIPDTENIVQASPDLMPGLSQDERGAYVLITDDGYQIPLLPAPKDPDAIVTTIPGSEVLIGNRGETTIRQVSEDGTSRIVGIFDPMLSQSDQPPGLYRTGSGINEEALVVYQDGTAQRLLPMIQSPDEFLEAAGSLEGVDAITFKIDGTISLQYQGTNLILRPTFDVVEGGRNGTVAPSVAIEDGRFFFTNMNGDRQEFLPVE